MLKIERKLEIPKIEFFGQFYNVQAKLRKIFSKQFNYKILIQTGFFFKLNIVWEDSRGRDVCRVNWLMAGYLIDTDANFDKIFIPKPLNKMQIS